MTESSAPPELNDFPVGHIVAERYQITEHLGYGGMGFVVKVKDLKLDGEIGVLKILYPRLVEDLSIFARFRREVLITRMLSHPNLVRIYDFGEAGKGTYYISMEYIEGENLGTILDRIHPQALSLEDATNYLFQVAVGLDYAHSLKVIHRDIKPENIIIGPGGKVKITDFGVARSIESKEQLTHTNEAVGSPHYMSPEQINAQTVDGRSDVYGLGIMAYELVVGKPPFDGGHWIALARMHLSEPVPEFASKEKGIPYWFQELVMKASAKEPGKRFQTAGEFAQFIADHCNLTVPSGNWGKIKRPSQGGGFSSALSAPMAVMMVVGLLLMGGYFLFSRFSELAGKL